MTSQPTVSDIETVADLLRRNRDWALTEAADTAEDIAPGVRIETASLDGAPAYAVIDAAQDALMLAVGSRGVGAFTAMTLGSVGRYAATHAHCPVVVVRDVSMAAHREVVVAIRDLHDCDAAIGLAFEEAALRTARLVAVHAWHALRVLGLPVPGHLAHSVLSPSVDEIHENVTRQLGEQLATWTDKYPQVEFSLDVVHGHPGRVLAGLSARADLVVLGRHSANARPGTSRVVHAVLSHAHGPVIVVPSA